MAWLHTLDGFLLWPSGVMYRWIWQVKNRKNIEPDMGECVYDLGSLLTGHVLEGQLPILWISVFSSVKWGVWNQCSFFFFFSLAFLSPELPRFLSQYSASFHTKPWPPCNLYRSPFICSICGKMVLVLPVRWLEATKNKSYCKALCVE